MAFPVKKHVVRLDVAMDVSELVDCFDGRDGFGGIEPRNMLRKLAPRERP